jgi:hypothetical protein
MGLPVLFPMVPNGAHPVAPFAMNQNNDASLGLNQDFPQDQGFAEFQYPSTTTSAASLSHGKIP